MTPAKDLSKEPPRSPRLRIRHYPILARTIDKCRATLAGTPGEYHFNCPLDNVLFGFKNINGEDFKKSVQTADSDEDVARWVDQAGTPKTEHEIVEWAEKVEHYSMADDPERGVWFQGECRRLGLDPTVTSVLTFLEADDAASFGKPHSPE